MATDNLKPDLVDRLLIGAIVTIFISLMLGVILLPVGLLIFNHPREINLLSAEKLSFYHSGGGEYTGHHLTGYDSNDNPEYQNDYAPTWSYFVTLYPVDIKHLDCIPGFDQNHQWVCLPGIYAMTAKVEKDGIQYRTWFLSSTPEFQPEDKISAAGYTLLEHQYFFIAQTDFQKDPGAEIKIGNLGNDAASALNDWLSYAYQKDGIDLVVIP